MITKDEITIYICSCALFLKEMLMFRYIVTIHLVMNSFGTLFHDTIFFRNFSLTCFKFPDISRFSRQVVTLCNGQQQLQCISLLFAF